VAQADQEEGLFAFGVEALGEAEAVAVGGYGGGEGVLGDTEGGGA
jgi:hypothetical protein